MKLCKQCGAHKSDERTVCVDCGERLGNPLSSEAEGRLQEELNKKMEKMYHNNDPLHVSIFDKIVGAVSALGLVVTVGLMMYQLFTICDFTYLWAALLCFFGAVIVAVVPQVSWEIEKLRLSFYVKNADDAEPTAFYTAGRKIAEVLCLAMGAFIVLANLFPASGSEWIESLAELFAR